MIRDYFRRAGSRLSCAPPAVFAFIAVVVLASLSAGSVRQHAAVIIAGLRDAGAALLTAAAVAIVMLTARAVSRQPVYRQLPDDRDAAPLPRPEPDPGWETVASLRSARPAPPVPLPGRPQAGPVPAPAPGKTEAAR